MQVNHIEPYYHTNTLQVKRVNCTPCKQITSQTYLEAAIIQPLAEAPNGDGEGCWAARGVGVDGLLVRVRSKRAERVHCRVCAVGVGVGEQGESGCDVDSGAGNERAVALPLATRARWVTQALQWMRTANKLGGEVDSLLLNYGVPTLRSPSSTIHTKETRAGSIFVS